MLPFFPSLPNHGCSDPPLQQGMMIPHLPNSPNPQFPVPMMGSLSNLGGNTMGMPSQQQRFQNSPSMPPMAQNNQMGIGVLPQNGSFGLNQVMALQLLGQAASLQQSLPQFQNQLQNMNFLSQMQLGGRFLANNLAQSMNQFPAGANGQLGVNIPGLFNGQLGTTALNSGSFGNSNGINPPNFGDAACVDAVNHEVNNGQFASNHEMGSRNHNFLGSAPNSGFGSNPNMAMSNSNANFRNAASNGANYHALGQGVKHGQPMGARKFQPPFSRSLSQSDGSNMVNYGEVNGSGVSNLRNEYSMGKNSRTNPKGHERGGTSNVWTQKPQFHHANNAKWNTKPFNRTGGRGHTNGREGKSNFPNDGNSASTERRRFVPVFYSEHEIKQWIEARKKNFPTRANIEKKKLALNGTNGEEAEENTKLCRQQLKEVLVKQAELGFEAPEIPPGYLSEPGDQLNGKSNERKTLNRSNGSLNGYNNKRGKYNQRDRRGKRPKLKKEGPTTPAPVVREPTLLQKLLNAEIKGDKSRLLQAFRFVLLNSFFESWPEKPLEFPSITVQETVYRSTAVLGANPSTNDVGVSNFGKTDDQKGSHVVEEQNRSCEDGDCSAHDADTDCDFAGKEDLKHSNVADETESSSSEDESDSVGDDTKQLEDSEEGEISA